MAENQGKEEAILDDIVTTPYKYGFTTNIETEEFEKGLSAEIVKRISSKKNEPSFLRKFRDKAFLSWKKMNEPDPSPDLETSYTFPKLPSPNVLMT